MKFIAVSSQRRNLCFTPAPKSWSIILRSTRKSIVFAHFLSCSRGETATGKERIMNFPILAVPYVFQNQGSLLLDQFSNDVPAHCIVSPFAFSQQNFMVLPIDRHHIYLHGLKASRLPVLCSFRAAGFKIGQKTKGSSKL